MNMYDQLIKVADNGIDLAPDIAEKWDVSTDGTEFTFHIQSGIKFSDGSDMKVSDIKWSIDRAQTTKESPWTFTSSRLTQSRRPMIRRL